MVIEKFRSIRLLTATALCLLTLALWGLRVLVIAPVDVGTAVLFFFWAATLPLAVYLPTVAALAYLVLFALTSFFDRSPDVLTLTAVLLVTVITAQNKYKIGVFFAIVATFLGFYSPDQKALSMDPQSVTIFTLMMVLAFVAGWLIDRANQKEMYRKRQMRRRQVEVASLLHDTIAADLTALIVRLEALAISTPKQEQALRQCAATARRSISGIRALVYELNAQAVDHPQATVPTLTMTLMKMARTLQEHGFHVESTTTISVDPVAESINKAFNQCLSEASANIIKYAAPHSTVNIAATAEAKEVIIVISNTYTLGRRRANSSGFGLASMRRTIATVGGEMTLDNTDNYWSITFHVPV